MDYLKKRILDISYHHKLSHIGSCLTALPILVDIFSKKPERFILSSGHAGLALYVILESLYGMNAESLFITHGIHPCRSQYIDCSTGSLGMGITIATGLALAGKDTHCLISDGECAEGCVWESLAFKKQRKLHNLHIYVNINGYSAYDKIDENYLEKRLLAFDESVNVYKTQSVGLEAHYHIMTEEEYEKSICEFYTQPNVC